MRNIFLSLALAFVLISPALAGNVNNSGDDNLIAGNNLTVGQYNNGAGAGSTVGGAGGAGGAGGSVGDLTTKVDVDVATGKTVTKVDASDKSVHTYKSQKQAPSVFAPALTSGFECMGSVTGGGSAGFGSIILGGTTVNKECLAAFLARTAYARGKWETGDGMLCELDQWAAHDDACPDLLRKHAAFRGKSSAYADNVTARSAFVPTEAGSPAKH